MFFCGRLCEELERLRDGALAAQAIDEIAGFLGNDYSRKLIPLRESRGPHDRGGPSRRGSYFAPLPVQPGCARFSRARSMAGLFICR